MADPLDIPENLTLPALQAHLAAQCAEFGWDKLNTEPEKIFLLFAEEIGELAKAIRRRRQLQIEQDNPAKPVLAAAEIEANLREEFADVFSYTLHLANALGVDLADAYCEQAAQHLQRFRK